MPTIGAASHRPGSRTSPRKGLGEKSALHWSDREIDEGAFKDARFGRRVGELLRQIADGMGESIPHACQDWANTKAAYRSLANKRVEESDILSGRFAATRERYDASEGPILLLQDTTVFSFQRAVPGATGVTRMFPAARREVNSL